MPEGNMILRKSRDNYVLRGTLGGMAEYFGWSPRRLRLVFVMLTLLTAAFPGILLYIALSVLMPEPEKDRFNLENHRKQ